MFKDFIYNSNAGLDGILVHSSPGDNDPSTQSHNDMNMTSYYLHTQWYFFLHASACICAACKMWITGEYC